MQLPEKKPIKRYCLAGLAGLNLLAFFAINSAAAVAMYLFLNIRHQTYLLQLLEFYVLLYLVFFAFLKTAWQWLGALLSFFAVCLFWIIEFYYLETKTLIDFPFLLRNARDFLIIAGQEPCLVLFIAVAAASTLGFLFSVKKSVRFLGLKKSAVAAISLIVLAACGFLLNSRDHNHLLKMGGRILVKDPVISAYQEYYENLVKESAENKASFLGKILFSFDRPAYLDNIIILQLESLNSRIVSTSVTPNFLDIARQGFYFSNFYANSPQTIFGQENILCGLPTSFELNLVQTEADKRTLCLPFVFKSLGYDALFAKTFDLNFTSTGDFMSNIGFGRVMADSLMRPDDPRYDWGWREDVFYQRFFEYVKDRPRSKNFWMLEIGPTNHWPFDIPEDLAPELEKKLPFPDPKNWQEKISNTSFVQDHYLGLAYQKIQEFFPEKNWTLLITSDHAWPLAQHDNNFFNQKMSFQENFSSPLAVVFGPEEAFAPREVKEPFSLMDIMPSLLELSGIELKHSLPGTSFIPRSSGQPNLKNVQLLVQPYSERYINILNLPRKLQYNADSRSLYEFNLDADPQEKNPRLASRDPEEIISLLKELLP